MIADAAPRLPLDDNGILFIETSVPRLASFDLGKTQSGGAFRYRVKTNR